MASLSYILKRTVLLYWSIRKRIYIHEEHISGRGSNIPDDIDDTTSRPAQQRQQLTGNLPSISFFINKKNSFLVIISVIDRRVSSSDIYVLLQLVATIAKVWEKNIKIILY